MIWNTYELPELHLSRATVIFVVDCCQFGPSWMFGLKMNLMACAGLVGGTTEQSCIFYYLKWYYYWYKIILNCLNYTSAMPQPFLLLIAANLTHAGYSGWKWSLWPVPIWLAVQPSKAVFFLILYDTITYMKRFWTSWFTPSGVTAIFVVDCCQFGPNWMIGLKLELLACTGLVGGTTEQSCIFHYLKL